MDLNTMIINGTYIQTSDIPQMQKYIITLVLLVLVLF